MSFEKCVLEKKGFNIKDYGIAALLAFWKNPLKIHDTALMARWQIVLGNIRLKIKNYSSVQIYLKIQDCSYVVLLEKKSSKGPRKIILGTAAYEIKDYSSVKLCLESQDGSYDVLLKKSLKHLDDPFPLVPLKIIQSRIAQEGLKSRLTAMMSFRK